MNCNNDSRPPLGNREDEINSIRLIKQIKTIRSRIGSFGHIIKQEGQKSLHLTKDKTFHSKIYMMINGSRELIRQTEEAKDLDATIVATLLHLRVSTEWTEENPEEQRSVEADITVKWWRHSCESKSGAISSEDKMEKEHTLTTLSTNEDYLPEIKIPKIKVKPPRREASPPKSPERKRKRKRMRMHSGDKIEPESQKVEDKPTPPPQPMVTEDPGPEPPEEQGEEAYKIWKKKKSAWASIQVNLAADRRGLKPKKDLDAPSLYQ